MLLNFCRFFVLKIRPVEAISTHCHSLECRWLTLKLDRNRRPRIVEIQSAVRHYGKSEKSYINSAEFKCLIVSIIPRKFLYIYFDNSTILFILVGTICVFEFAMVPGVYILLCPPGRKGTLFFLHIHYIIIWLYHYSKTIVELENNTNRKRLTVYGACNLTKQHFGILICFWF